jgi:vacuolar-type H+-ATPase subunit H
MKIKKELIIRYVVPALLAVLMFSSNFLNKKLFGFDDQNFAVWFVLSVLCFACGWYINQSLGWHLGGRVVFSIIVAATFISIIMITFFQEYFDANEMITENLLLYSLRNIMLGAMAFFGMAVAEVMMLQKELLVFQEKQKVIDDTGKDLKKEAELELKDAKIKAQKILNDAESEAKEITLKKDRIEKELKEFIRTEKEFIKKYEKPE